MRVTAIVLAGGRSSRFGSDKLAADLGGTSLLAATIAAVAPLADGVIVAGPRLPDGFVAADVPVALVRDVESFAGPLVALENALHQAAPDPGDLAIVVGGDMPSLVPAVLQSMLDRLAADRSIDAVLLESPNVAAGPVHRQVLPLALRVAAARPAAATAVTEGDRSIGALVDRLRTAEVPIATWLGLDPERRTLRDVDTPSDLERVRGGNSRDEWRADLR